MNTVTNTREAQIAVAIAALQAAENGKTKKEIADDYGVSVSTVRRYTIKYEEEAQELLSKRVTETAQLIEAFKKTADKEAAPEKLVVEARPRTKRGGKARNGRVALVRSVISSLPRDATVKDIYEEAQKQSDKEGLPKISKGSFISIVHQVMKKMNLK